MSRKITEVSLVLAVMFLANGAIAQEIFLVEAFPELSFQLPVFLTNSKDNTNRIFVLEKKGRVLVFPNDAEVTDYEVFLDIQDKVDLSFSFEKGLLGLEFHPDYANNGYFYVFYTSLDPDSVISTVISRFSVDPLDPDKADTESEVKIMEIVNTSIIHFGGTIKFGQDGCLYISRGDGGTDRPTPWDYSGIISEAQNLSSLLGSILRIDVDNPSGGKNYGIPTDNPFYGNTEGYREEIWAWGLRNPWRFSIDEHHGRIWVGEVGHALYEEVNIIEKGNNYGWNILEGIECFGDSTCDSTGLTPPIIIYTHDIGCSITGGYVYHGSLIPEIHGDYIYGDFCTGKIWSLKYENGQVISNSLLIDSDASISSFGLDENNELYVTDHSSGRIFLLSKDSTGTDNDPPALPASHALLQNYPNPFNSHTLIEYTLSKTANVSINVYNLSGNKLVNLIDGQFPAGRHHVHWHASDLPSGIYFYRLQTGDFVQTKKMLLFK